MSDSVRANVLALAGASDGIVTVAQAQSVGASRGLLPRWANSGEATRVARGTYLLTGWPDGFEARAAAVSVSVERVAAISHFAAARLLDLPIGRRRHGTPEMEITYYRRRRLQRPPVTAHESNVLMPGDVVEVGAARVTGPAFTIGALAPRLRTPTLARLLDASITEGRLTCADAEAMAKRLWACPGVPRLRDAIDLHRPGMTRTRSERERALLRILRDGDLPLPEVDVEVVDDSGRPRFLDFAYPSEAVLIEFDSNRFHEGSIARSADGRRQNDLLMLGDRRWLPLRFDDRDLDRPAYIVSTVERALASAADPWASGPQL